MSSDTSMLMIVGAGQGLYAFPAHSIEIILPTPPYTQMPLAPAHVFGVMNYKSSIVPVYSLAGLGGDVADEETPFCLVVKTKKDLVAFAVQNILGVRSKNEAVLLQIDREHAGELPVAAYLQFEQTVQLLDI